MTGRRRLVPALLPVLMLFAPPLLPANTILVTSQVDEIVTDANCTLREAVIAANTDTAVDSCPAGSNADTIVLPPGTYVLTLTGANENRARSGDLDVVGQVVILGAGRTASIIDGGSFSETTADRVLHVLSLASLTVSGVTIRGGYCEAGGGIYSAGRLLVHDSSVTGNRASEIVECYTTPRTWGGAGIYNRGELTITNSTVSDNEVGGTGIPGDVAFPGGALLNRGRATIEQSVLHGNFAAGGGGIWNSGDLHVTDSEIRNNGARFWAAGLENPGKAVLTRTTVADNVDGGIMNGDFDGELGWLILRDSTVSGNQSFRLPGAIFNFGGPITITGSTIAGNHSSLPGAGISGPATLKNSIVANSDGDCIGPILSRGDNLDSDGSCGLNGPGDLPGTDPRLGPLADNGGPTRTRALLSDSPAIDHIPLAQCGSPTDQRGVARPQPPQGACDIGAYEFVPAGAIIWP